MLAALLGATFGARAEKEVPPLTGPVVDQAGMLRPDERDRLERLARGARDLESGAGVQLQFLLVPSLEGEPIETFAIRVAERWKLGTRGKDNGLLFIASRDDRRLRIEVGGGLEGGLTDAQSGRIIQDRMVPAFREGRFGAGLYAGAVEALDQLGALPRGEQRLRRNPTGSAGGGWVFFAFIALWLLLSLLGRRRRGGWMVGPGFGAGLGSGGWGGGGGGFSGGGASGNW